jgi:hypothetical protein
MFLATAIDIPSEQRRRFGQHEADIRGAGGKATRLRRAAWKSKQINTQMIQVLCLFYRRFT